MTNHHKIVLAFIAIIISGFFAWTYLSAFYSPFWTKLGAKISAGHNPVAVSELTEFSWDTVCLFSGYPLDLDETLKRVGITITDEHRSDFEWLKTTSDVWLIFFAENGRVISVSRFPYSSINIGGRQLMIGGIGCNKMTSSVFAVDDDHIFLTTEKDLSWD